MSEKCFCHLNGYKVKDADARKSIEEINENLETALTAIGEGLSELQDDVNALKEGAGAGGSSGGTKLYKHRLKSNDNNYIDIDVITTMSTPVTKLMDIYQTAIIMYWGPAQPILGVDLWDNELGESGFIYYYEYMLGEHTTRSYENVTFTDTITEL